MKIVREKTIKYELTSSPEEIYKKIIKEYGKCEQEYICVIGLNNKNECVFADKLFVGGMNECSFDMKILFKVLLLHNNVTSFVMAHNHPSGHLSPSEQDIQVMKAVKKIADLFRFNFFDSIIFNDINYYSSRNSFPEYFTSN